MREAVGIRVHAFLKPTEELLVKWEGISGFQAEECKDLIYALIRISLAPYCILFLMGLLLPLQLVLNNYLV